MSDPARPAAPDADRQPPATPRGDAAAFSSVADVAGAVLAGGRSPILLLSDFDGTLCEFRDDPESVRLADARRAALSTLARRPGVCVGIVSGRRAADIRERAGLDGPVYHAGLHGMEIAGPDGGFTVEGLDARRERCGRSPSRSRRPSPPSTGSSSKTRTCRSPCTSAPPRRKTGAGGNGLLVGGVPRRRRGPRPGAARPSRVRAAPGHRLEQGSASGGSRPTRPAGSARRCGRSIWATTAPTSTRSRPWATAASPSSSAAPRRPAAHRLPDPAAVERLLDRLVALTADR